MQQIKVTTVKPGAHAEKIGLKIGDILDSLDGITLDTPEALTGALTRFNGTAMKLNFYRMGKLRTVDVSANTLGVVVHQMTPEQIDEHARSTALAAIIVTTAPSIERRCVRETLDIVSAECVVGVSALKDIAASLTDLTGGRSRALQDAFGDARQYCLDELRSAAKDLGADAVIATSLAFNQIAGGGKSMLFAVATGTAVKLD